MDEIALTTNGILLEQKAEQLKKAGLDSINVSLDCLDEALFARITRGGDVGRVLSGMDKARKAGMKLKINSVILRGINEQEIVPLADFAQRAGVLLRFIELMPINVAQKYQGLEEAAVLQRLTAVFGEKSLMAENSSPAHYYKFAAAQMPIGFISALSHKFCARCNRIRLTAAGFLKPCLHDRGGRDLKILLSEGASDEQIVQAIRETVYQKPCSHHLTEASFAQRETQSMSLIGG